MSTDADFANARHIPPIPPRPPQQPAAAATPQPHEDPRTTVLRRVPGAPATPPGAPQAAHRSGGPTPPSGPTPPAGSPGPAVPPRPTTPPAAGARPPRPNQAPATPPPPRRPDAFRDTAAFHLANSQGLWNGPGEHATGTPPPVREPASATPPASKPAERPPQPPWPRTPLPHQHVGAVPGMPAAPRPPAGRRGRLIAAVACLVLGIGLIAAGAAGSWLTGDSDDGPPTPQAAFAKGRDAWRNTPVDTLFPRTIAGLGVGPGGADRTWTRIAVAPDSGCAEAYDPELAQVLTQAGCVRLLRATYTDATRSSLITVGAQTARTDPAGMMALNTRFSTKSLGSRTDLMPLPYAAKGTLAEGFGRAQRASWTVRVLTDIPVVVFAVSGFADGRTVTEPQPAEAASRPGVTTAPAEAGLGHDAKDIADRIEADFRTASGISPQTTESTP
ncbi:hypothetical protein ACWD6P_35170 [Streptomyces sp. NPDC002446]